MIYYYINMKTFSNTVELIKHLPKFMIPFDCYDIYWYVKLQTDENYKILIPEKKINQLVEKFGEVNNTNKIIFDNEINNFLENLKFSDKIKTFRSGKIIYYDDDIPDDMIQCYECGNIWDGNAQCNCYSYGFNEFY